VQWIEESRTAFWEIVRKASSVDNTARADGTFPEGDERQRDDHGSGSRHQRRPKKVNRYGHIVTCCVIFAIAISGGLSADTAQDSYQLPSDAQVIGYLLQSVTWYRHLYTERQVASDPGDLVFLNDNQAL
jgi:hypothetical protein